MPQAGKSSTSRMSYTFKQISFPFTLLLKNESKNEATPSHVYNIRLLQVLNSSPHYKLAEAEMRSRIRGVQYGHTLIQGGLGVAVFLQQSRT